MFKFGNTSEKKLKLTNNTLELIARKVLSRSVIDFGITHSYRTLEEQNELFKKGASKIDGINKKSMHNYNPSNAIDIVCYVDGKVTWEKDYYVFVAGMFIFAAKEMGVEIRWGGNFDMDNDILEQDFNDLCHFEIIDNKYKTKE